MKNKLNFSERLKILFERESATFMNNIISDTSINNDSVLSEIAAAGPLYGLKYLGSEEGVLSFSTYQKQSIKNFSEFLDNHDCVDMYDISAVISDPLTHESEINIPDKDFDFDTTRESEHIEYFIDVVIKSDLIDYNSYYDSNIVNDDTSQPFIYPLNSDEPSFNNNDGYDVLSQNETPLVITLSNIKSASQFGSFSITAHPENDSKLVIQCNYSDYPEQEDVLQDLKRLNSLDFGDQFKNEFKIIKAADYELGDLSTTAAVYQSVNSKNVLNIITEMFNNSSNKVLTELTRVIKVNSLGKKRIKMQCQKGFKYDPERKVCVKISGNELAISRIAHRQMSRTKRTLGQSYKTRIVRRIKRAKRFRKLMGL